MSNINRSFSSKIITAVVEDKSGNHNKRTRPVSQITLHHAAGYFESSLQWLTQNNTGSSAHFIVDGPSNATVLMNGPSERVCWSDANSESNAVTVSIEMSNSSREPHWKIEESTLRRAAELCAELSRFYGLGKLTLHGNVKLHSRVSQTGTSCPGPVGTKRAQDVVNWANELLSGNTSYKPSQPNTPSYKTGTVIVTADVLHVRAGASTKNPIVTSVKKNEIFTITEIKGDWGKLLSSAGWIHLGYTSPIGTKENNNHFKISVVPQVLHVRSEPNVNSKINTRVSTGEVYTITETSGSWGKLLSGAGWIHLDYTKRL